MLTGEAVASRRRGRPLRLPEDPTPLRQVHGGVNQRVSWLLTTSRLHAKNPALAHREPFVAALNALGVAADQQRAAGWWLRIGPAIHEGHEPTEVN